MPIRTFGRDISNIPMSSVLRLENQHTHSKQPKKIKLKYPKNSVSRRQFGFEASRPINKSSIRPVDSSKRYISSSSLTDRNKNLKPVSIPKTNHQLYKWKIPILKEIGWKISSGTSIANENQNSIQKWTIRSSIGMIKPIKSLKPRSMSRSQLGDKENINENINHATTATHLPNLHNMSTASLLSQWQVDKKQNSIISNRTNYGSQKKLSFKLCSKTPTNIFVDKMSSSK